MMWSPLASYTQNISSPFKVMITEGFFFFGYSEENKKLEFGERKWEEEVCIYVISTLDHCREYTI